MSQLSCVYGCGGFVWLLLDKSVNIMGKEEALAMLYELLHTMDTLTLCAYCWRKMLITARQVDTTTERFNLLYARDTTMLPDYWRTRSRQEMKRMATSAALFWV